MCGDGMCFRGMNYTKSKPKALCNLTSSARQFYIPLGGTLIYCRSNSAQVYHGILDEYRSCKVKKSGGGIECRKLGQMRIECDDYLEIFTYIRRGKKEL